MPDLEEIIDGLGRNARFDAEGDRITYVPWSDAVAAVHAAADTRTQEILAWLEDPDVAATTFYSTRDVAFSLARRFPSGGANDSAGA